MSPSILAEDAPYRSYIDQCLHYLDRPSSGVPDGVLDCESAWRGADIGQSDAWQYRLTSGEIDEIQAALQFARQTGKPLGSWRKEDFPLPTLKERIAEWRLAIQDGLGFQLVRGLPVGEWDTPDAESVFWALGLHLGIPGAQNPQGDLLGHVKDRGRQDEGEVIRLYQTPENIAFHCDAADVVGLLCLTKAAEGGASRIASSLTVWNELWKTDPKMAMRLLKPVYVDLREERSPEGNPWNLVTPCIYNNGTLKTFYHSDYFRSAVRHTALNISEDDQALFERYDEIANDPEIRLDMNLEPGDIQLVSNHCVVHARTSYKDSEDQQRHLLRLWLSL